MSRIIEINSFNPQPRLIKKVVDILKKGGVIAYPTDTMYGIGCDIFNKKAVERVYRIKERAKNKPFSFICPSLKDISKYGHVNNSAYRIMKKNLPGAYTFVLPGTKIVPKIMLSKQKTVGIRIPDHPTCLAIVEQLGNPLVTTSASAAEDKKIIDAYGVADVFGNRIDLIIDGGTIYPEPSSVIALTEEQPLIIRAGKGEINF